jgi:tetratricopeptide (TPR) repeat protein
MKTQLIYLTCMICILNSLKVYSDYSLKESLSIKQFQNKTLETIEQNDSLLYNIQQKIYNAFVQSQITQSDQELSKLELTLSEMNKQNNNSLIAYWYSYTCYYHSIFYMIKNDNKNSEKILDEGMNILNQTEPKTSEHLALLAMMESFSIQFAPGTEAAFISKRVKENGQKAMDLDSANLRSYFVLGSNDFYTPEQYGGGKKAEGYLKKAILLEDQSIKSPYLPSWGKNSAYELLIRFYIRKQQWDEAKKYFKEAIGLYPNDYMINQLSGELINR